MLKRIIICADDYGEDAAISQAIIELLRERRLSATTCLATSTGWLECANWLKPFKNQVDIGIHFNLTHGKPLSSELIQAWGGQFPSIATLIKKAYLRKLNRKAIMAELHAQLDQFTAGIGEQPHFMDGHQHIHQLPIVRDSVIAVYHQRLASQPFYLRSVQDKSAWLSIHNTGYIKKAVIQLCGASAFKKQLLQQNIAHNSSFSGIYDFAFSKNYSHFFPQFLQQVQDGGLIMCHPGLTSFRHHEYLYFRSEQFLKDCEKAHVALMRFRDIA